MKKFDVNDVQKKILKEHNSKQNIQCPEFNPNSNKFVLSDGRKIRLTDSDNLDKITIFKAIHYVNYLINYTDELAISTDKHFKAHAINFINFVNERKLDKNSNTNILKEFEIFRVDNGIKPQSSGAKTLRTYFRTILAIETFTVLLTSSELDFLTSLSESKLAPSTELEQSTLTSWFSEHTWLRRDDVGVGADLYTRFSSPKALMKSFSITIEISLLEVQKSKYTLIDFFKQNKEVLLNFHTIPKKESTDLAAAYSPEKERIIRANINLLRVAYNETPEASEALKNAMSLLIKSFSLDFAKDSIKSNFFLNRELKKTVQIGEKFGNQFKTKDSFFFTLDYIYELIQYAKGETREKCPTSKAEHLLFQWMMASLSVQPSDIPKLRLCDFKILRKSNGSVVSIESEYFKGRANDYHVTEGVRGSSKKGQALLNFITDMTANYNAQYRYKTLSFTIERSTVTGRNSGYSSIFSELTDTYIYQCITNEHLKKSASNLIINSLNKLSDFGINYKNFVKNNKLKNKSNTSEGFLRDIETPLKPYFFFLSHIKNSSVHAKSDYFDPTRLLNYRSHTNETERKSYLTPANEEWQNNCGLITRAIMQDIYSNVYRLSDTESNTFNNEFMNASEAIEQRKNDTLARLKLVTGKEDGEIVNELGIRNKNKADFCLKDTIYIIDSGETVMKLKHYIYEAEVHSKALLESNPIFLFNTVLPTVEWIESLFLEKKFSKKSSENGRDMFNQYVDILPPIFQSHGA